MVTVLLISPNGAWSNGSHYCRGAQKTWTPSEVRIRYIFRNLRLTHGNQVPDKHGCLVPKPLLHEYIEPREARRVAAVVDRTA